MVRAPKRAITITQGSIVIEFVPEGFPSVRLASLRGTNGFSLEAILWDGIFPGAFCRFGFDCAPGETIPLQGLWVSPDVVGTARLQGQTFTELGSPNGPFASMGLTGSVTLPPEAEEATVRLPFTLEGVFGWPADLTQPGGFVEFEGRGTATLSLRWNEESWLVSGARFEFRGGRP